MRDSRAVKISQPERSDNTASLAWEWGGAGRGVADRVGRGGAA